MQYIVEQSNQFALECIGGEKFASWTQITVEELQAYMGFMILMGLVKLPSIYDYWRKDEIYHYSPIALRISSSFTATFTLLTTAHLPLQVVLSTRNLARFNRSLTSYVSLFNQCTAQKRMCVDEAMIPFKGRSTLKQYMPLKPVKRGIKVWALADASNGCIYNFKVYTGKDGDKAEKGLGANVVMTLTEPYVNTYRHVYFNNYFTSFDLLLDLEKSNLYGCGRMRSNRKGFPTELKPVVKKRMKERGESKTYQHENLTVCAWQDNKTVLVAANNSDPTVDEQVLRKKMEHLF